MIRIFDICISLSAICLGLPIFIFIYVVGLFDTGAPLFFQERVGKNLRPFTLLKFRTMHINTESRPTHLTSAASVTKIGSFLRRSKLDELPQLWNVLIGDMSLVGPRPCLPSQKELIQARIKKGVYNARPGITGLAQINHIDMSTPDLLAETDNKMLTTLTLFNYLKYIFKTIVGNGAGDKIRKA